MNPDLNENDMMLATILLMAGAIAFIAVRQMEIINAIAQYQVLPPIQQAYNVPLLIAQHPPMKIIESAQCAEEPMVIMDSVHVDVCHSDTTFMGYNENDDLVSIARRLPNGEIVRRKIRDPELELSELEVAKWVEFNEYQKESNMTWM